MLEPEMAFADLTDNMDLAESLVTHLVRLVMEQCAEDFGLFAKFVDPTLPATFASRDCPLITLGAPNPFPTPLVPVDPDTGFAFNLANTMWGTNTCMVVPYRDDERDATFRFTFTLGASSR